MGERRKHDFNFLPKLLLLCSMFIYLTSCNNEAIIENYYINDTGILVAVYDDGTIENLGNFNEEVVKSVETIIISDDGYYVINGVETDILAVSVYKVGFNSCFSSLIPSQDVKDGYKVERPQIDRNGYTLKGWFCNGEEWLFNSHVVKNDMTLNAEWIANQYTVSFSTGTTEKIDDYVVTYDSPYELPTLSKIGYKFLGWSYNGSLVNSKKWDIADNCTLVAKWAANKYMITIDANGGIVSKDKVNVQYGEEFSLPVPTNDYGVFLGWFCGDVKLTDELGNSLKTWDYTCNIEVSTSWIIDVVNVDDLKLIETYPKGHFKLKNNIDVSSIEWKPLCSNDKPFAGEIVGDNHYITGLSITNLYDKNAYYGFIGYSVGGSISNINFENVNISLPAIQNTIYCGSVIGYNVGTSLDSITVNGSVLVAKHSSSHDSFVGGLIGYSLTDKVQNCTNNAKVVGQTSTGGIIGCKESTKEQYLFANNSNTGTISGATCAGGMIGNGEICFATSCQNSGDISGSKYVGGLFGYSVGNAIVQKSFNIGTITMNSSSGHNQDTAGGIIGSVSPSANFTSITDCFNQGNIISDQTAGGFIGHCNALRIQNCYNSGDVKGTNYVGGMVGISFAMNINQCINFGTLSSKGIVATMSYALSGYNTTISDCFYNCVTSGVDSLQGEKTTERFSKDFYISSLFWSDSMWKFYEDSLPTLKIN